jgi:hypothetical protein
MNSAADQPNIGVATRYLLDIKPFCAAIGIATLSRRDTPHDL